MNTSPSRAPLPTSSSNVATLPTGPTNAPAPHDRTSAPSPEKTDKRARLSRSRSNLFRRISHRSDNARRDSGMAPSSATAGGTSQTSAAGSAAGTGSTSDPSNVPSIVVEDQNRPNVLRRPKTRQTKNVTKSEADGGFDKRTSVQEPVTRIVTPIPSPELDDLFATDNVEISKRGSVILNGSRSTSAPTTARHARGKSSVNSPSNLTPASPLMNGSERNHEQPNSSIPNQTPAEFTSVQRPPPSTIDNNRQHRNSTRVRSWYGDQPPPSDGPSDQMNHLAPITSPISEEADVVTALPSTLSPRLGAGEQRSLRESRSFSAMSDRSSRHEGAGGGMEDWTNLETSDVDRYGFYDSRAVSQKRVSSVISSVPGSPNLQNGGAPASHGAPRSQSAQVSRTVSMNRNNRLSYVNGKAQRTMPSVRTNRTSRSTSSRIGGPFNRGSRLIENAPIVLAPSPGLYDDNDIDHSSPLPETAEKRALERKRTIKWARMATSISTPASRQGAGTDFNFPTHDRKLISRTWKGIPDCWRAAAWYSFLSTSARKTPHCPTDTVLETFFHEAQNVDCPDDVQIDTDVPRTVGSHILFRQRYKGGQRFLFRVLRALALYFPETGYVQGMASVVATLLNYYTEDRAFVMAVRLWTLRGIGWLYSEGFGGLMAALEELEEKWCKPDRRLRGMVKHLEKLGIHHSAWGPKWYLTLFNYVLPFEVCLRVWDVFMLLGHTEAASTPAPPSNSADATLQHWTGDFQKPNLDPLHAVSAAMLHALSSTLQDADFENAMGALTGAVGVKAGMEDRFMDVARRCWDDKVKRAA